MTKFAGLGLAVEKPGRCYLTHPRNGRRIRRATVAADIADRDLDDRDCAWVDVYSGDSKIARDLTRAELDGRADQPQGRTTALQSEVKGADMLARMCAAWNLFDLDGNPVDVAFEVDAARELFAADATLWIRDQVDIYAGRRANFVKPSSTS